ncbi:MAG: N-acetyl-gamma-glutamyl-phosphate reductase, partial [Candidatus Nanopelagicaceae bacterium]
PAAQALLAPKGHSHDSPGTHDVHTSIMVLSVAIDNLGKGAAGQAIQNANLLAGFDETLGLMAAGLGK